MERTVQKTNSIYQWLFKMNGFKVADDSVFLYSNGIKRQNLRRYEVQDYS